MDGFLGQHTSIFGGFWVPSWTYNPKKIDLGPIKKLIKKLTPLGTPKNQFWEDFGFQNWSPRGPQKICFGGIFWSWAGLGAKMAPRSPQDPPRPLPSLIFMDFGPQLVDFIEYVFYYVLLVCCCFFFEHFFIFLQCF